MVDALKEVDIVRSTVLEKCHPERKNSAPTYYAEPELSEKFRLRKGTKPIRAQG